jgi:cardiolipin-specific phospholipase
MKYFARYLTLQFLHVGSGEYAANAILQIGGYAKYPLIDRIKDLDIPIYIAYGDKDWIPFSGIQEIID